MNINMYTSSQGDQIWYNFYQIQLDELGHPPCFQDLQHLEQEGVVPLNLSSSGKNTQTTEEKINRRTTQVGTFEVCVVVHVALRMFILQVLVSQLHFLANRNAELAAVPPLFWPANHIKTGGHVALLSGPAVYSLYYDPNIKFSWGGGGKNSRCNMNIIVYLHSCNFNFKFATNFSNLSILFVFTESILDLWRLFTAIFPINCSPASPTSTSLTALWCLWKTFKPEWKKQVIYIYKFSTENCNTWDWLAAWLDAWRFFLLAVGIFLKRFWRKCICNCF